MNYYSHYEKYLFLKRHFQKKHVVNICGHEGLGKSTLARYLSRDGTAFVSLYGSYGEMRERIGECVSIVSRMGKAAPPGALVVDNCELPWGGSGLTLEPVFQAWSGVPDDSGALLVLVWNDAQAMERHSIPGSERVRVTGMSFADFSRSFPHLSPAERVENFAAFGGMPVALNWVRQRDALSNVLSLIEQDGYALHFPTDLMARHTREYTRYLDIMRAVASGFRTHSAISEFTGIPARELSRYLSFLTEGMAS